MNLDANIAHGPLRQLITLAGTAIAGDTIVALRFISGLAGAITLLLTAYVARLPGGGSMSRSPAALSACLAPAFPAPSSYLSMNPIDVMLCTLSLIPFLKTIDKPQPGTWVAPGRAVRCGAPEQVHLAVRMTLIFACVHDPECLSGKCGIR